MYKQCETENGTKKKKNTKFAKQFFVLEFVYNLLNVRHYVVENKFNCYN